MPLYFSFYVNKGRLMDKLRAMGVFVRIVEANSFTKAAETLGLPRAALTERTAESFRGT